jgi:hypothetical protein
VLADGGVHRHRRLGLGAGRKAQFDEARGLPFDEDDDDRPAAGTERGKHMS